MVMHDASRSAVPCCGIGQCMRSVPSGTLPHSEVMLGFMRPVGNISLLVAEASFVTGHNHRRPIHACSNALIRVYVSRK